MLEVGFVRGRAPEVHIRNLEVAPEVAGRVAVGGLVVARPPRRILDPLARAVLVQELRVRGDEFLSLGPQRREALRGVVQVDGEAVGFVVVLHVTEDVVVDVAEEVHFGLDAPVVADLG